MVEAQPPVRPPDDAQVVRRGRSLPGYRQDVDVGPPPPARLLGDQEELAPVGEGVALVSVEHGQVPLGQLVEQPVHPAVPVPDQGGHRSAPGLAEPTIPRLIFATSAGNIS